MIAQIIVFSRKTDMQRKKNFAFVPKKLHKSFANGNPNYDENKRLNQDQPVSDLFHFWTLF